jgi:Ca2+-binding RTX toxin-like protein
MRTNGGILGRGARLAALLGVAFALAAPAAWASDANITYEEAGGGSGTATGGTTTMQGASSNAVDLSVYLYSGSAFTEGGLTCEPGNALRQCDGISIISPEGALVYQPCVVHAGDAFCPDANTFVGNLGPGNDDLVADAPLEYDRFTVHGGGGNDTVEGTHVGSPSLPDLDFFYGEEGQDTLDGGSGVSQLFGGNGPDLIGGGAGNDELHGEGGNDNLYGGEGGDIEDGGPGNDLLGVRTWGNPAGPDLGSDAFVGGPDTDVVSYREAAGGVSVTVDGLANDGEGGESDNIGTDVEEVEGTMYGDTLNGGPAAAVILAGEGGNDVLSAGSGTDTLVGGAGNDSLTTAAPGGDSVFGDAQSCALAFYGSCPAGNDTVNADDGVADQINCGPGADTVSADALDAIAGDPINGCETATRSAKGATPAPAPAPESSAGQAGGVVVHGGSTSTVLRRGLAVSVSCAAACKISATGQLSAATARRARLLKGGKAKPVTVASAHGSLAAAGTKNLKLKLSATAKRHLKHLRKFKLTVRVTVKSGGKVSRTSRSVTVRSGG